MVAMKLLAGLLCSFATAQEITLDEIDVSDGLNLLQLRSQRTSSQSHVDALVQEAASAAGITQVAEGERCPGNGVKRGKFGSPQECADSFAGLGVKYMAFWKMENSNTGVRGICIGWSDAQCDDAKRSSIHPGILNTLFSYSEEEDVAAAVGDPHMTVSNGAQEDVCCDDGPCRACDLSHVDALFQEAASAAGITQVAEGERCPGNGVKRGKFGSPQECADSFAGLGVKYMAFWKMENRNTGVRGICIGWSDAQCDDAKRSSIHPGILNTLFSYSEEEEQADVAEAVGDPHMTVSNGAKQDLCCEGGHCHPCQ